MKNCISWKRISIFFIIATIISNIFRFDVFGIVLELEKLPTSIFILFMALLEGSGVITGALIVIPFLKRQRETEISLFGTSKLKSFIMMIVPIALLIVVGVGNDYGMNNNLYGFIVSLGTFIYCVMEEYGWRAYLQEELRYLKEWKKYSLIGFIWYLWHLFFLNGTNFISNIFFLSLMILGAWGIGKLAEFTKSIMVSAWLHMIVQIMMFIC